MPAFVNLFSSFVYCRIGVGREDRVLFGKTKVTVSAAMLIRASVTDCSPCDRWFITLIFAVFDRCLKDWEWL